jgi:hypothetical protein
MGRPQEDIKTSRIYISPSVELAGYLNELARIGIHGKTKSEVANALISREIERLVKEEILKLKVLILMESEVFNAMSQITSVRLQVGHNQTQSQEYGS